MSGTSNPQQQLTDPAPVSTGAGFNPFTIDDDPISAPTAAPVPAAATAPGPQPPAKETVAPAAPATPAAPAAGVEETPAVPSGQPVVEPAEDAVTVAPVEVHAPVKTDAQRAARERTEQLTYYAARRRKYTLLVLLAVGVAVWYIKPWSGLSLPGLPGPAANLGVHSTTQSARPAGDPVKLDMRRIHQRLQRTGDLTGMRLPGADVAAAGTSLYAARKVGGQCVVYGVVDGTDIVPQADSTGLACAGQIEDVQAQLDAADANRRSDAISGAEQMLAQAADSAAFYASQNYSTGGPSLTGLPAGQLGGATIVANHGTWVQLKATAAGTCRTAIVAVDGTLGEPSAC